MAADPALIDEAVQTPEVQGEPVSEAPEVQTPEVQGQEDAETGLFDLSTVPEEYRQFVEPIAKDIGKNADAKLREAAEYRKGWESFEELGLQEYDPEGIGALLQFADALGDPDTARSAIPNLAESIGVDLGAAPAATETTDETPDELAQLRAELTELREARDSDIAAAEQAKLEDQTVEELRAEWREVEEQHGGAFSPEDTVKLRDLAKRMAPDHDEPIKAAYAFITGISGDALEVFVNGAPDQPAPAEPAGVASTTATPVDDFEEAERLYRERRAHVA